MCFGVIANPVGDRVKKNVIFFCASLKICDGGGVYNTYLIA